MESPWHESRRAFADAADWFVRTAALVGERWGEPGLGEWDVRALVGHTSRSFLTVETYLGRSGAGPGPRDRRGRDRRTGAASRRRPGRHGAPDDDRGGHATGGLPAYPH